MIPSRPNGVLNQGTPANGYGPWRVCEIIIIRSDAEREIHSSRSVSVAWTRQGVRWPPPSSVCSAAKALSLLTVSGRESSPVVASLVSQPKEMSTVLVSCGFSARLKKACLPVISSGLGSKVMRVRRMTWSSPS